MDVTTANFIEALAILESLLPTADFVAFDLEFTGLGDTRPSQLDTPVIRYRTARTDAEAFPPIQFGLAVFRQTLDSDVKRDETAEQVQGNGNAENGQEQTVNEQEDEEKWQIIPFNFNIFPRAVYFPRNMRYPFFDRIFKVQSSSVKFLANHGFDFMRNFDQGVSWLRADHEKRVREHVSTVLYKKRFPEKRGGIELQKQDREALDKFKGNLKTLLSKEASGSGANEGQSWPRVLPIPFPYTPLQRRAIYDYLREEHKFIVATEQVGTISGPHLKLLLYNSSEAASVKRKEIFEQEVDAEVAQFVGFRYVIDALRKSKVPIVVHNGLMDSVKLYANFVNGLPEQIDEFKAALSQAFPSVFDTRWMLHALSNVNDTIKTIMEGDKVRSISETCSVFQKSWKKLSKGTCGFKTFIPTSDVNRNKLHIGKGFVRKGTEHNGFQVSTGASFDTEQDVHRFGRYAASEPGKYDHEAGFDAQETGRLFVLLRKFIQSQAASTAENGGNDFLDYFKSKIYLGSCGGYSSVDLNRIASDEENDYLEKGNAFIISGEWKGNPSPKQKDNAYHRCRQILKKVTEGTDIDGNASQFSLVGPKAMLVILQMKKVDVLKGKRSREGSVLGDQFAQQLSSVVSTAKEIGLDMQPYSEMIANTKVAEKKRKCG